MYFEDCVKYIIKHGLYRPALEVFSNDRVKYLRILTIYAEYLFDRGETEDSGMLYALAGKRAEAIESYRKSGMWKEAFTLAKEMNFSTSELKDLAEEFKDELVERNLHKEAAQVMLDYAKVSNLIPSLT